MLSSVFTHVWVLSRSVVLGSFQPQGLSPARLHCPWYFTGKNTGVGCHFLLQGNLPDPGIEPVSLVLQADSLPLSHLGSHCLHSVKCSPERESNSAQPPSPFLPAALLLVQCRVKTRYLVSNLSPTTSYRCIVVQSLSAVWPCDPMDCSTPGFPVLHHLPELAQTHVHETMMLSNHLILSHPLFLLPSIFPNIRVFSNEPTLYQVAKVWSFSFSISPSNEYSGLISFRIDWFDLLEVQGTLKSLIQQRSWKALVFWHTAFFMVQLSHPYMTTGKIIALTIWTFVAKYCLWFLIHC